MTKNFIALDRVEFTFAEGCLTIDGTITARSWKAANANLSAIQLANKGAGGYTKVDVRIVWSDGQDYALRYDVEDDEVIDLGMRVIAGLDWQRELRRDEGFSELVGQFMANRDLDA